MDYINRIERELSTLNLSPKDRRQIADTILQGDINSRIAQNPSLQKFTIDIKSRFEITKENGSIMISPDMSSPQPHTQSQKSNTPKVDFTNFAKSRPKVIFLQPFYNQGDLSNYSPYAVSA
jgi:hypothetical protein